MKLTKVLPPSVAVLLFASAWAGVNSSAQSKRPPAQLPPLPLKEKLPAALAPVVGAERAFARHSVDHGMHLAPAENRRGRLRRPRLRVRLLRVEDENV